ncbi:DsbA family protein [uncultured Friedmanniella sp.]|uniref:DsbA family oxidoreductase n=1 Tax=uncultured Friedmanniella sp. TaxID=335381 RepID=UPI0035CAFEA3
MTTTDTDQPTVSPPPPGVLQLWSDLLCPFTHVALHELRAARERLGPGDPAHNVQLEHHAFPLELFNGPHLRRGTDTEAVGLGQICPAAGFRVWTGPDDSYPHTVLTAAEAVLAAGAQSRVAGEALDAALRAAFWTGARSIAHRAVVLEVAEEVAAGGAPLDTGRLTQALDSGRHRADLMADVTLAQTEAIPTSPTFVLPDGTVCANPGITVHWEGPWAAGYPIVDAFNASAYIDLLRDAAR